MRVVGGCEYLLLPLVVSGSDNVKSWFKQQGSTE